MSTIKISQLPPLVGADANGTDVIPIVDTSLNTTNKITRSEFFKNTPSVSVSGNITVTGTVDGRDISTDGTKLDGIEAGAEVNPTASEIKTLYESNANTNAFTDAEKTKLSGIEAGADVTDTANVTAAGALMDSELTNITAVKALNQGVATTDSPSFVGITLNGTAVTATATELNILDGANATLAPKLLANPQNYLDPENRIINGAFDFWQRGTSFTATSYTADRWGLYRSGQGTTTVSRTDFTIGTVLGTNNPKYHARVSTSGEQLCSLFQPIEDVRSYAGQTITILGWARRVSGSGNLGVRVSQRFGAGGSPSADVYTYPLIITLGTNFAPFAATISVPSVTGKTRGTYGNDSLFLELLLSDSGSLGLQTIGVDLWGIHIKVGTHTADATSLYRQPELGPELARCQRYYQVSQGGYAGNTVLNCFYSGVVNLRTKMRAVPTISRLSDVAIEGFNTPFVERVSEFGFSASARANVTRTGDTNSFFSTLYASDAEL